MQPASPKPDHCRDASHLWLAVHCPHLALDLLTRGQDSRLDQPIAISDGHQRRQRVLDCNPAAIRAGIRPGMPVGAARGLAENLHLAMRNLQSERAALERLAAVCYQYSGQVALITGHAEILLEIGGSQRLFGGAGDIAQQLEQVLQRLGYHACIGTAPTPEAARLAARHGLHLGARENLQARISHLPMSSLQLDSSQVGALEKMGFRSVGEILRLPRKGLARRLGIGVVDYLDRLSGARPDPRKPWQPPEQFAASLELVRETSSSQALMFPLRRLVAELCGILQARDRGVQAIDFELHHDRGCESLSLGLRQTTRNEDRILLLLRERLERLSLPAPVRQVGLRADRLLPFAALHEDLFPGDGAVGMESVSPLLERLQARLGEHAVVGLRGIEDHRPEHSWSVRELHEPAACAAMPHRPVWLFSRPQRCRINDYQLISGPERIETGWWDGQDCRRDYFVVRDTSGRTLWAFQEYKPCPGWYLQGLFA